MVVEAASVCGVGRRVVGRSAWDWRLWDWRGNDGNVRENDSENLKKEGRRDRSMVMMAEGRMGRKKALRSVRFECKAAVVVCGGARADVTCLELLRSVPTIVTSQGKPPTARRIGICR